MKEKSLKKRLVYASFITPLRLALMFELPMTELVDLMQMAAFHETKRRGLKMKEVSSLLDISMRKVSLLSQRLRKNFAEEEDIGLARRIEFMLWAEPMSEARILQVMRGETEEEVREALSKLEAEARVTLSEKDSTRVYYVSKHEFRLVGKEWSSRLDGVNNLMSNIANAIDARFFHNESHAFARTLSFRIREEDIPKLEALYKEKIWAILSELDELAHDDPNARTMDFSVLWAPYEYIIKRLHEERYEE